MIVFYDKILKTNCNSPIVYFNLNSYYHNAIDISKLMPSNELLSTINVVDDLESQLFDNNYANEIMNNNEKFNSLISIISFAYNNPNGIAIILIENGEFRNAIRESLMKFIQCRYGLQCYSIEDENDFIYLMEQNKYNNDFNGVNGIFNLTDDMIRHMDSNPQMYLKE